MQRQRTSAQRDDPFVGRNLMSSFFGGGFRNDPFDDPFFTRPFGSLFGSDTRDSQNVNSTANRPVIKELDSNGEEEEEDDGDKKAKEESLLTENKKKSGDVDRRSDGEKMDEEEKQQVKSQSFCYRKVTYGGVDGVYRTSTVSRRTGSDGVVLEESKAADTTTGQAEHRISRGIQNKGHSVTRMLKPDGKVETMQTLHNLNEDELAGFEESWKGNASKQGCQWKDEKETKKKHSSHAEAGSGGWGSTRVNLDKKMSPIISTSTSGDTDRISSSNVGAKKVIRIPIE